MPPPRRFTKPFPDCIFDGPLVSLVRFVDESKSTNRAMHETPEGLHVGSKIYVDIGPFHAPQWVTCRVVEASEGSHALVVERIDLA